MEFKGTKGKWEYTPFSKDSNGYINVDTPGGMITAYNGFGDLDIKTNREKCIEIAEANAKLIACAPDMLEMLQKIEQDYDCGTDTYKILVELIKKATE